MREVVSIKDAYKLYKKTKNHTTYENFMDIQEGFFKFFMSKVFDGFTLEFGEVGKIGIVGRKMIPRISERGHICGIPPNWRKTKEHWIGEAEKRGMTFKEYVQKVPKEERQIVFCFNEHSNGMVYNICWWKRTLEGKFIKVTHQGLYSLRFSWGNKRHLNRLVVEEGREYEEVRPRTQGNRILEKEEDM